MPDDHEGERLARLLASVKAEPDPALWTRVSARLAARERAPAWLVWAMRPAALGASLALLAVSLTAAFALVATTPSTSATPAVDDLADALVAEADPTSASAGGPTTAPTAPEDSGGTP